MYDNNDVNDIKEYILLYDNIFNPSKRVKRTKYYYSPILQVCIYTRRGK